jgi:hypothetical protein
MFDEYGYPTEETLEKIAKLSPLDESIDEIVEYLIRVWHWHEDMIKWDKKHGNLQLHTGGWSGNESVISALEKSLFWMLYWYKSIRGGHYYFKVKRIKKAKHLNRI